MKSSIYCLLLDKRKNYILTRTSCISCLFFGGGIDSDRVSRKKKHRPFFFLYSSIFCCPYTPTKLLQIDSNYNSSNWWMRTVVDFKPNVHRNPFCFHWERHVYILKKNFKNAYKKSEKWYYNSTRFVIVVKQYKHLFNFDLFFISVNFKIKKYNTFELASYIDRNWQQI